jgi:hypothetical protein
MTGIERRNRGSNRLRSIVTATMATAALCAAWLDLGSASSAAAVPLPVERCAPSGSKTLASDPQARVYSAPVDPAHHDPTTGIPPVKVFGCTLAAGKTVLLGSTAINLEGGPLTIDPRTLALSDTRVAYSLTEGGTDFNQVYVALRNLATGRVERRPSAAPGPLGPEGFSKVTAIGVDEAGAFAWISVGSAIGAPHKAREVAAVDPNGEALTLDTAEDIDPRSLTLEGDRLEWTDGGVGQSAVLR